MSRSFGFALSLPHRYPFRLIDGTRGEVAVLALTQGSRWAIFSASWLAEAMAQAAALLLRPPGHSQIELRLGGLEALAWHEAPAAGMVLEFSVKEARQLGRLLRVAVEVRAEGRQLGSGTLWLAASGAAESWCERGDSNPHGLATTSS